MTGAGGRAERIDILGPSTSRVINGNYTSCRRDGAEKPDWVLSARQLDLDIDAGVGVAEGAVLRFLDVPILSLPRLSFPLSDQRKSGWLPPNLDFTTGSGIELSVPYYWNIAPNRDATITPAISTRRGFAVNGEFRYLEPTFAGRLNLDLLPYDQVYEDTRYWLTFDHAGRVGDDLRYGAHVERVSDDDWWNDFPRRHVALTPRLLPLVVLAEKDFGSPATRRRAVCANPALAGAAGPEHHGGALRPRRAVRPAQHRQPAGRCAVRLRDRGQPLRAAEQPRLQRRRHAVQRLAPARAGLDQPALPPARLVGDAEPAVQRRQLLHRRGHARRHAPARRA